MMATIPFYRHDLGTEELQAISDVLSGPILTTGDVVAAFENRFADYLETPWALGVSSCTGALHLSLLALGVGPGDEVITTPMTFIATATAILSAGATPVFVDVEEKTGNIDVTRIEASITGNTRAIIPVHLYGQMCDMLSLGRIAGRHGLKLVEDSAHCIEGMRDGVRPGQLSDTACFSFYATKNLTCGEGGAVTTTNPDLHKRMKLLSLHGMSKTANDRYKEGYQHWDMPEFGWKYNMSNLQAAMLLPQLARLEGKHASRLELAALYEELLSGVDEIEIMRPLNGSRHARHLFTVRIRNGRRDRSIERLRSEGVEAMVNYRAIHLLTYFRETLGHARGDFPVAERIGDETVSLPFYPDMPEDHVRFVATALVRALA